MKLSRTFFSAAFGGLVAFFFVAMAMACVSLFAITRARALATRPGETPGGPTAVADSTSLPGSETPTPLAIPSSGCPGPSRMNILLLGMDSRARGHDYSIASRSDSITVISVNFEDSTASMLSIPRDLWVAVPDVPGVTENRINAAYAYGEGYGLEGGGPGQAMRTVTLNFGIRLDRYLVIDFQAFVDAVDAVGGIDIDVPEAIRDDRFPADTGRGTIVFEVPAGLQHMDGVTALRYARTRNPDNDFGRIRRQQLVMFALRDKILSPDVVPQLPGLIQALYGSVRTDLTPTEIAGLACLNQNMARESIHSYIIDDRYVVPWVTDKGAQVIIPDRDAIAPIVTDFNGQ